MKQHPALLLALPALFILIGCSDGESKNDGANVEIVHSDSAADSATTGNDGSAQHRAVIHFTDITDQSGIDAEITSGELPSTQILEVKGGGLALIDYDNDGLHDLFIPNGATLDDPEHGPGARLYRNRGDLTFEDVTEQAGITHSRWSMGVAVGDYNGDGFDDIFIACYGPDVLLQNDGDGRFVDVTETAGLGDDRWATSASWGDIDRDGDLDLYVTGYVEFDAANPPPPGHFLGMEVMRGPMGLQPEHDLLYENLGDGTLREIGAAANARPEQPAFGLNVVILDLDNDGWQDIFVGNDSMANFYYHNNGDGTFSEIGGASGIATNADGSTQATMGIAIGDLDHNGYADLFTTNFSSDTNTLHINRDGRWFEDRTSQWGLGLISRQFLGWAAGFFDFDLDGDEDLLMFNGHVYPQASQETINSPYLQPPLLFENRGERFYRVDADSAGAWLDEPHRDRAAVFGDLDHDGDVDVIVGELNGPVRVLRNDIISQGQGETTTDVSQWLIVELQDQRPQSQNHRGIGSRIVLRSRSGDAEASDVFSYTRWIYSGGSFQSANTQQAHFGIPPHDADNATMSLTVHWPDGVTQHVDNIELNQRLTVMRTEDSESPH